jgi:hypothetical protein
VPLDTAILALNPLHYWKLNETSGTTFTDYGSTGIAMEITGDTAGMGWTGPELDTFAMRVFASTSIASSGLGISGWGDFSIQALISAPANGAPASQTPAFGLGNATNVTQRGFWASQLSSSNTVLQMFGNFSASGLVSTLPWPQSLWHLWTWTWTLSPNILRPYTDGIAGTTQSNLSGVAPTTADVMWIKSSAPLVIAHLAYWPRALTQTEIQTVSTQIQAWPYGEPINVPYQVGSGSVDLTPVLTDTAAIKANQSTFMPEIANINTIVPQIHTQTTTMETNWSNYTAVTLPSLNDRLQQILDGVTSTITGAGGAIAKTIGQLFTGPAFDQLSPESLGTACAPSVIDVTIGVSVRYGLQMQCTSYADWYVFTGNADDYTTQALGTLQVFRGNNEVLRQGLHTLSHMVYPLPGVPSLPLNVGLELVPAEYRIVLTPAPETCWQLEALVQP